MEIGRNKDKKSNFEKLNLQRKFVIDKCGKMRIERVYNQICRTDNIIKIG